MEVLALVIVPPIGYWLSGFFVGVGAGFGFTSWASRKDWW